jgi:hypothetical protein
MRVSATEILSSMLRWPLKWPTASETIVTGPHVVINVVIFQNYLPSAHILIFKHHIGSSSCKHRPLIKGAQA